MNTSANPSSVTREAADALYAQQKYAEAAYVYRQLVTSQPANADFLKGCALSLALAGSLDDAIEMAMKAAALRPADPDIRYAYGYVLGMAHRFEDAIPELDAALSLQPNHLLSKNALVYSLIAVGKEVTDSAPDKAEAMLSRAHKLDSLNGETTALLLSHYFKYDQTRKAVKVVEGIDLQQREHNLVKPYVDLLCKDPNVANLLRPTKAVVSPKTAAPSQALQQVPCPQCGLPIMSYAAICSHCNSKLRAVGTFADVGKIPDHTWQEVAYMIMSVLYTIIASIDLISQVMHGGLEGFAGVWATITFCRVGIGIGLIMKTDWIGFVAKIGCYASLIGMVPAMVISFFGGAYLPSLILLAGVSITCFMIYLINYELD